MDRVILHCDCNSFFASVESIDHPEYRHVPMAVAGDPSKRHGIILAKNELAKGYGVKTAETIWQARRKCPQLVIVAPHHHSYEAVSRRINGIYAQYTDQVEPFSIDESWLDVTASRQLFGDGPAIADALRAKVRQQIGVTISVGVSFNKTFAKMGSDYKKPDATTVITRDNYRQLLWPLDIGDMMFVGKSGAEILKEHGLMTIGAVAQAPRQRLIGLLGKGGSALWDACNGLDDSPVEYLGTEHDPKSISNSETYDHDLTQANEVRAGLLRLSDQVAGRLRQQGMRAYVISIAVKDPQLQVRQKQRRLTQATAATFELYDMAWQLLGMIWKPGLPIRLLAVAASGLTRQQELQGDLFSSPDDKQRDAQLDDALDAIRQRFGDQAVGYARLKKGGGKD